MFTINRPLALGMFLYCIEILWCRCLIAESPDSGKNLFCETQHHRSVHRETLNFHILWSWFYSLTNQSTCLYKQQDKWYHPLIISYEWGLSEHTILIPFKMNEVGLKWGGSWKSSVAPALCKKIKFLLTAKFPGSSKRILSGQSYSKLTWQSSQDSNFQTLL